MCRPGPDFPVSDLGLRQPATGYRFGLDPLILAAHVLHARAKAPVLDIGTGNGVIALLLARCGVGPITGVEIQDELYGYAVTNVRENGLDDRVRMVKADFTDYKGMFEPRAFHTIVCNPPFYPKGSGRTNPSGTKAIARHEIALNLSVIMQGIRYLLTHNGTAFMVYPAIGINRLTRAVCEAGLSMAGFRVVFPMGAATASIVVAEIGTRPNPETQVYTPWYVPVQGRRIPPVVTEILEECNATRQDTDPGNP